MRPTFEIPVPGDGATVLARIGERLAEPGAGLFGQVRGRHAFVRLPEGETTMLSPHLNLELRDGASGTVLFGRFSPHPNVWMGFMAVFFVLGLVGLGGVVWAAAQAMIGGPVWSLWAAPAALALIAFIYGAAFIGQGLSSAEMYELRAFVEFTVREVGATPGD
jgi:hypothetical protein